jgi:hypothetical protein
MAAGCAEQPAPLIEYVSTSPLPTRCACRVDDLISWLAVLKRAPANAPQNTRVSLVKRPMLPPLGGRRVTIGIDESGVVSLEGREIARGKSAGQAPLPKLRPMIAHFEHSSRITHPKEQNDRITGLQLEIDQAARWRVVAAVLQTLAASGPLRVALVFTQHEPVSRPKVLDRDPAFQRLRLLQANPAAAAEQLAKLWRERLHARCPDTREMAQEMVGKDPAQRIRILANGLPEALQMCNCRADLPAVRGLLYITSLYTPPLGGAWRAVSAKGVSLVLPGDARWQAAYKTVLAAKQPLRVGVK